MILDYIGQELIWKLRGTHPYEKNNAHYSITYRCKSYEDNVALCQFITKHIALIYISEIICEENPFAQGGAEVVKQIKIKNAFGEVSKLKIINGE